MCCRKSVTSAGVGFGWNEIIHTLSPPWHMIAQPCSTLNNQWGLNCLVNFPRDLLCLNGLAVESGWIRFAERQSIHFFWGRLSREITPEASHMDNANLISNKQICPIFNNAGTVSLCRINTELEGSSHSSCALKRSLSLEGERHTARHQLSSPSSSYVS